MTAEPDSKRRRDHAEYERKRLQEMSVAWRPTIDPDSISGVSPGQAFLDSLPSRPDWHAQAACSGDPDFYQEVFFPTDKKLGSTAADQARAVCRTCTVQRECLIYAMEDPARSRFGVFAFTTVKQRETMRTRPFALRPEEFFGMAGVWQEYLRSQGRDR